MEAKTLSQVEQDVLAGKQDDFLAALLTDGQIAEGDLRVSDHIETELKQNFLSRSSSQQVVAALQQGCSLRDAAAMASMPIEVARKVLAVMQKE